MLVITQFIFFKTLFCLLNFKVYENGFCIKDHLAETTIFIKSTSEISKVESCPTNHSCELNIKGILGILIYQNRKYLAVVKFSNEIDHNIQHHKIENVTSVGLYEISNPHKDLHSFLKKHKLKGDQRLIKLTKYFGNDKSLYFSKTLDLSNKFQSLLESRELNDVKSVDYKTINSSFCANYVMLKRFLEAGKDIPKIEGFVVSCIHGYVGIKKVNNTLFGLISRRNNKRVGTRFQSRGIDTMGNVSNFFECENFVVDSQGKVKSFVQIRGSIPLLWKQKIQIPLILRIDFSIDPDSNISKIHFDALVSEYGSPIIVFNLLNNLKGTEKKLTDAYEQNCKKYGPNVEYHHYNLNEELKKCNFNVSRILEDVKKFRLEKISYFDNSTGKKQQGITRTNCLDCLDRTNLVCYLISRVAFFDNFFKGDFFKESFSSLWAENGNALSQQYTGSEALNIDLITQGNKNLLTNIKNYMTSTNRKYQNVIVDRSFSFFSGRHEVFQIFFQTSFIKDYDNKLENNEIIISKDIETSPDELSEEKSEDGSSEKPRLLYVVLISFTVIIFIVGNFIIYTFYIHKYINK